MSDDPSWLNRVYDAYEDWKGWDSSLSAQECQMADIELSRARVPPPARVLEVGFGSGAFLLYLKSLGYECWGIERQNERAATLESAGLTIRSGELPTLPAAHFDLVCVMDVLEHLTKPELLDMLQDIRVVLRPGGMLLARFPNGASPFGAMNQSADLTHLTQLSISSFSQACCVVGLEFSGGWNSAVTWRADGIVRSLVKPFLVATRRLIEVVLGAVYYGERRPLDLNVTVCARRPQ